MSTTVKTTHVMTTVGLLHIKGSQAEVIKAVNDYFHESDESPADMFLHLTAISPLGEEELAVNPSQIAFIGKDHDYKMLSAAELAAAGVDDAEGEAEVIIGHA